MKTLFTISVVIVHGLLLLGFAGDSRRSKTDYALAAMCIFNIAYALTS